VGSVEIVLYVAKFSNYACWQNSIPLLRSQKIRNGMQSWSDLRLELDSAPPVERRKVRAIDRLGPGDELAVTDQAVKPAPDYLVKLERSRAATRLTTGNEIITEIETETSLLAGKEWCAFGSIASLIVTLPQLASRARKSVTSSRRAATRPLPSRSIVHQRKLAH